MAKKLSKVEKAKLSGKSSKVEMPSGANKQSEVGKLSRAEN